MAEVIKGEAPTKEGKKLVGTDFTQTIASLGEARAISRQIIDMAVGQFNPEYISIPRLYQMRRDTMNKIGLYYTKAPLIRAKWHIECEDPKIKAGMTELVKRARQRYMKMMLNRYDFGYQAGIKTYQLCELDTTYENDQGMTVPVWDPDSSVKPVEFAQPISLPPEHVNEKLEKGKFAGILTHLLSSDDAKDKNNPQLVPPEFSVWRANEFEESFMNYYGYPRLGYAYRYWWSYWFRFHMEDRHFEQDADPPLQVWYPPGDSKDSSGNDVQNRTVALQLGSDLRGGATIAIPSDVHIDEQGKATTQPLWKAEFLEGGENLDAFRQSNEYLDVMKLRSVLLGPEQSIIEGKGGTSSRNVAGAYNDIHNETLAIEAEDEDTYWNEKMIPDLLEANWGADAPKCRIVTTGFEAEDVELRNALIEAAFNADPNALPIKFETMLTEAGIDQYTAQEQEEREQAIEEAKAKEMEARAKVARAMPAGPGQPAPGPAAPGQPHGARPGVDNPGFPGVPGQPPVPGRPPIKLSADHQHGELVESTAPEWARREGERRRKNTDAIAERLERVARDRYAAIIDLAAEYFESEVAVLQLGVLDDLGDRLKKYVADRLGHYADKIKAEMASMFHASGAAHINDLGLDQEPWDVGREEVQDFADQRAQFTVRSMDETIIDGENGLTDFFWKWLAERNPDATTEAYQIPYEDAHLLAQDLQQHFKDRPEWMARRLARTEARRGYNLAGAQIWRWAGIDKVKLYDGLGGLSGKTDEVCLARNGQVVNLDQFIKEDEEEHPNGTLGAVPVTDGVDLAPIPPGELRMNAVRSATIYAMTGDGLILSIDETREAVEQMRGEIQPHPKEGRDQRMKVKLELDGEVPVGV